MKREEKIKEDERKQNEAWSDYYRQRSIRRRKLIGIKPTQDHIDRCEMLMDNDETRYPFEPPHGYY
jgi:hypothetical protein